LSLCDCDTITRIVFLLGVPIFENEREGETHIPAHAMVIFLGSEGTGQTQHAHALHSGGMQAHTDACEQKHEHTYTRHKTHTHTHTARTLYKHTLNTRHSRITKHRTRTQHTRNTHKTHTKHTHNTTRILNTKHTHNTHAIRLQHTRNTHATHTQHAVAIVGSEDKANFVAQSYSLDRSQILVRPWRSRK